MTPREALTWASGHLRAAGIEDAANDARRLLAHALHLPAGRLIADAPAVLSPAAWATFERDIARRARHQPVAQITGRRLFAGLSFRVTPAVLDPRPETETLVAEALARPFFRLLDLGTGSGCILLSCLHRMPMARGIGTDISEAALAVARENARALGLSSRARLARSDWFRAVSGRHDLITANPPYVRTDTVDALAPEVRDWEPRAALDGGADGLDAYRIIARDALSRLMPGGGRLLLEIGIDQAAAVMALLRRGGYREVRAIDDLDGRPRVIAALAPDGAGCGAI